MSHTAPWPADHVERRPVAGLIAYARNARTHSPEQVSQIAASIQEWGWTMPVLVDERSSIIAAEMTGRACIAIEISPAYCDVAVLRWQAFTGQTATLERTGANFAPIKAPDGQSETQANR